MDQDIASSSGLGAKMQDFSGKFGTGVIYVYVGTANFWPLNTIINASLSYRTWAVT